MIEMLDKMAIKLDREEKNFFVNFMTKDMSE